MLCSADPVQEVGADHVVSLVEAAATVHTVVGRAVVPAVVTRGVPAARNQSPRSVSCHRNVGHVHQSQIGRVRKTIVAGMLVRSVDLKRLTINLLFDEHGDCLVTDCSVTLQVACITFIIASVLFGTFDTLNDST